MDVDEWLAFSVKHNASDLHLCSGHHPVWRTDGRLHTEMERPRLSPELLERWCARRLTPAQRRQLERTGQADCALTLASGERARVNLFRQSRGLSAAIRLLPRRIPSLEALSPPPLYELLGRSDGLALLTGATGSGKSTTLAAMVAAIDERRSCHVITLEDPVEFVHDGRNSLIQQREIGLHCASFEQGLRAALREDPDVILLGELRDAQTIRLALTAAETGHLVLATLHARGAVQAVERLIDVFPAAEKDFVRGQLASVLRAVVAQRLERKRRGRRVALFEVLAGTPAVGNLIREGKNHQLPGLLQSGARAGMQTFEQSRRQRCEEGLLEECAGEGERPGPGGAQAGAGGAFSR